MSEPELRVFRDGSSWCALSGENLQEGIAGFGGTRAEAVEEWEAAVAAAEGLPKGRMEFEAAEQHCLGYGTVVADNGFLWRCRGNAWQCKAPWSNWVEPDHAAGNGFYPEGLCVAVEVAVDPAVVAVKAVVADMERSKVFEGSYVGDVAAHEIAVDLRAALAKE